MKDFVGVEIEEGDKIVYAALLGRCAVLHQGVVVGFKTMEPNYMNKSPWEKIQVRIQTRDWQKGDYKNPVMKPMLVWLSFPERIIVSKKKE